MVGDISKIKLLGQYCLHLVTKKIEDWKELLEGFSKISNDKCHLTFGYLRNDAVPLHE